MRKLTCVLSTLIISLAGYSQNEEANITGNIESIFQYLNEDTIIDAAQPDSKGLLNTYMNVNYTYRNFKAGMRIESYLPRIQGYPNRFDGTGIGSRYIGYANDFVDVTLGSFYEQFGSGMAFRTYEDRSLGYDNMMDGARLIVRPHNGVVVKGVYGYQRLSFQQGKIIPGDGIVRGIDGEFNINSIFNKLKDKKLDVTLGGSFVSKYQKDDREDLILPENVASYGGRLGLKYGRFNLGGEYIIKEQDPSADNGDIYNYGHAALINFGYSQKGLGIMLSAKSVDNMSYRSDRSKDLQDLLINYLPSMNKVHSYNLVASLYPWATQPVGEIAYQAEVLYTLKKKSKLGGKYGTSINVNGSFAMRPRRDFSVYNPLDSTGVTYRSGVFDHANLSDFSYLSEEDSHGSRKYSDHKDFFWQDINVNIYRKFNKKFNLRLSYFNIMMNNDVNKVTNFAHGTIKSNIGVIEAGYKLNRKNSFRVELQGLFVNKVDQEYEVITGTGSSADTSMVTETVLNDKGNWATILIEYNVSPHWFFSVMDQYNMHGAMNSVYNFRDESKQRGTHYFYASVGYIREATRITIGYGRQRAGLFCVGGVCRNVPASNGLTLSFTHSF